jgi:hypothetical protein
VAEIVALVICVHVISEIRRENKQRRRQKEKSPSNENQPLSNVILLGNGNLNWNRDIKPGPLEVGLKLPDGRRAKEIRLLVAKSTPKTTITDSVLTVTVPKITDHEVIAISV